MLDPQQLTTAEFFWVAVLVALMGYELLQARVNPRPIELFRPTLILAVVLAYYSLLTPLRALALGEWLERGVDRRPDLIWGWAGAAVFYASTLAGFHLLGTPRLDRRQIGPSDPERLHRFGTTLCQLALLLFSLVAGLRLFAYLNPFAARDLLRGTSGASIFGGEGINNYFLLSINLLLPGVCLMFTSWIYTRRHLPQLILWLLASAGIYTSLGFRFRLVLLAVPLLLLWYLVRQRRPNLIAVGLLMAGLIFMAGFVELTRSYGRGLDVTGVEGLTTEEIFMRGVGSGEAQVFLTTSGMMAITPRIYPYVGMQPFISMLQFPIPSDWWAEKDTFGYLDRAIQTLFDDPTHGSGAALLCYGEWFLMAGWPSLILMSMLLGWLLRCLWNWLLIRRHEPLALTLYALSVSYLYLMVSRGYLAQVVAGGVFTLGPLFWIYRRWSRPVLPSRALSSLPRG
jgi:oligosaccharide repeat unit polymerase